MLKHLLLGTPTPAPHPSPVIAHRDWSMVLCFSCGKYGHEVGRCPQLDVTFSFMLPGWSAEEIGAHYVKVSPHLAADDYGRETATDTGWTVSRPDQ